MFEKVWGELKVPSGVYKHILGRKLTATHCMNIRKGKAGHKFDGKICPKCGKTHKNMSETQWCKGKTKETDPRLLKLSETIKVTFGKPEYKNVLSNNTRAWHERNGICPDVKYKERSRKLREFGLTLVGDRNPMYGKTRSDVIEYNKRVKPIEMSGEGNPMFGKQHTDSTKQRIREKVILAMPHYPRCNTSIELRMQEYLSKEDIDFLTNQPIMGVCNTDIFIPPNLCVFADGDYWHNYPNGLERDKRINCVLEDNGFVVLRFWERDIRGNIEMCIEKVKGVMGGE